MRILVDTNILFSALVFPRSKPAQALLYIADTHEIVLCDRNIAELLFRVSSDCCERKSLIILTNTDQSCCR